MEEKVILLVEDNPDDELLALRTLQNNISNEVVAVRDGLEAIDYISGTGSGPGRSAESLPQVILLDLKLPKVDGFEVLRRIRTDDRTRLIPVVFLTTSNEEQDRFAGYGLDANSFVRKRVEFDRFSAAVRQLGLYWLLLNEPSPVVRRT